MIDLKDVKIGNWVQSNGKQMTISGIDRFSFTALHDGKFYAMEDIDPIPITEEILLAMGFEWDDIRTHIDKTEKGLYKEFMMMLKTSDGKRWYAAPFGYPIQSARTYYVHQLQNLYFSISGEELNYQP